MKRASVLWLILLCLLLPLFSCAQAASPSLRGYDSESGSYCYVLLGEYPYEADGTVRPVLWRVLSADDSSVRLLTEYVIDTKQIIFETDRKIIEKRTYRRFDTFGESDLCEYLNTEMIHSLFPDDAVIAALLEDEDPENRGKLFPLTTAEFLNPDYGFRTNPLGIHPERQAAGTPWAVKNTRLYKDRNGMSTYWAATLKVPQSHLMQLVGYDGHLSYGGLARQDIGLRLSVVLNPDLITITGGAGTFDDPYVIECYAPVEVPSGEEEENTGKSGESALRTAPGRSFPLFIASAAGTLPAFSSDVSSTDTSYTDAASPDASSTDTALISFIGDCSIGDAYSLIGSATSYHSVVRENGYAWPFSQVVKYLAADDLTVANLEVVFTESSIRKDIKFPLRAAPDHVQILLEGSIEVVNTANNHCYDYKRQGYMDTRDTLDQAGVAHFGSVYYYQDNGFDDQVIRDVNGIRFGFVGLTYPKNRDRDFAIASTARLKEEEGCDVVVVSMHWGREEHMESNGTQFEMAKALIDAGADVVYGHHPHVLQPLIFYKNKPIMFSTGNFTFGTMSKVDPHTGIFQATYERNGDAVVLRQFRVIPCSTSGKGDYRPYELEDEKERERTFQILSPGRVYKNCENPPASFLTTGVVLFDENGELIPDP